MAFDFNKTHPECGNDEVFITNADSEIWPKIGWQTKRRGSVAYSPDGKPLGRSWRGSFPVFVKKDEILAENPEFLEQLKA
jgi:hypothetical protein